VNARRISLLVPVALILAFLFPASAGAAGFVTLSGKVTDQNGVGILAVHISFIDSCTGQATGAVGNDTSSTGTFTATVVSGIYDVEFSPPAGSLFTAYRIRKFDLTASRVLAPIALPYGITVSGRVTDGVGAGIANVYFHVFPPGSGERVYTVRDLTDASGNYSVVVAPGTYDLKYGPAAGTRYLGLVRPSVAIPGNTTLSTVALGTGVVVTGNVTSSTGAKPVINVNIDLRDSVTRTSVFTSHDRTDASGNYNVVVPAGTYLVDIKAEKCTLLVSQESAPTQILADTALPPVSLTSGVLVDGTVTDTRAVPIADVDLNYIDSAGIKVFTWADNSDATGAYSAVVPPDQYTVEYTPPAGSRLAAVQLQGVDIPNATTLPPVQLPDGVFVTGRTVRVNGAPLQDIDLDFFPGGGIVKTFTPRDNSDATGRFSVVVVPGTYDIRFQPPSTTTFAAKRLHGVNVSGDLNLGNVVIEQGLVVTGTLTAFTSGLPVVNADLDFFDFYTREKAETLHDNTDAAGNYSVVVPPRVYDVTFVPPAGAALETGRISGLTITSNISGLNEVLRDAVQATGRVVNSLVQPIDQVDLNFYDSASGLRRIVSRDNTAPDGTFGTFVPPGTYDIVFTPPASAGLAPSRINGVSILANPTNLGDIVLGQSIAPSISSITPSTGPASGGTAVSILGSNFQYGATGTLGGISLLNPIVVGPGRIDAIAPAIPIGPAAAVVDLVVSNVGAASATLPQAFTFTPTATPIDLTLTGASPSVVLSWPSTGQASYTIYRSTSPSLFGQAQVLASTTGTTFTDVGADTDGTTYFYRVE